jgi:hypothetical protein
MSSPNWYAGKYVPYTNFLNKNPPIFGCAALKASSGLMRVLNMHWQIPSQPFIPSEYTNFLKSFSENDIDSILSNSTSLKVTVVRHPISRFVSAWAQKFQVKGEFDQHRDNWLETWPKLEDYLLVGPQATHRKG